MSALSLRLPPALDAAAARARGWWAGRSGREQALLGVMGALIAGVIGWYGVIAPVLAARQQAWVAIRTHEQLNAQLRAIGTLPAAAPGAAAAQPPAVRIAATATRLGFVATVAAGDNGLSARVAGASWERVVTWLAELSAAGLPARTLMVTPSAVPGQVDVQVGFAP